MPPLRGGGSVFPTPSCPPPIRVPSVVRGEAEWILVSTCFCVAFPGGRKTWFEGREIVNFISDGWEESAVF